MSASSKTSKKPTPKKKHTVRRLMRFREFCEQVYDPLQKARNVNLTEDERQAIIQSVEERCPFIPQRFLAR